MARRKRRHQEEEHADETWLVPYSDILTLLLALFIVLFASSQVDQKKFAAMAASFGVAFNGNSAVMQNSSTPPNIDEQMSNSKKNLESSNASIAGDKNPAAKENAQMTQAKQQLDKYIQNNGLAGVETVLTDQGLVVRIKDSALFDSGRADLIPDSQEFAKATAKMLELLPQQQVIISGHTDNMPISNSEFSNNWDLSSRRALNFMKFLLAQGDDLNPSRFSTTAYGEYRPVADNANEDGRAKNRRVEVLILRNYH